MKRYPSWAEFNIEDTSYGFGGPIGGIGVYTIDGKFTWPDLYSSTEQELNHFKVWVSINGYIVPKEYR